MGEHGGGESGTWDPGAGVIAGECGDTVSGAWVAGEWGVLGARACWRVRIGGGFWKDSACSDGSGIGESGK